MRKAKRPVGIAISDPMAEVLELLVRPQTGFNYEVQRILEDAHLMTREPGQSVGDAMRPLILTLQYIKRTQRSVLAEEAAARKAKHRAVSAKGGMHRHRDSETAKQVAAHWKRLAASGMPERDRAALIALALGITPTQVRAHIRRLELKKKAEVKPG